MILTYTDFGHQGPYLGLVRNVLSRAASRLPVIDLMSDVPAFNPRAGAYLLEALTPWMSKGDIVLAVIDPGVGTERLPVVIQADGIWFVGPDNGVLERVATCAQTLRSWEISWRPTTLSQSFHGRDLFAPIAAGLASETESTVATRLRPVSWRGRSWPDCWEAVIYVDHYGNAMTAIKSNQLEAGAQLVVGGVALPRLVTFADAKSGEPFWYSNSLGLAEISVNQGSAAQRLSLQPGDSVNVLHR